MQDRRVLEIISNETKDKVCNMDVITPEIFANLFMQNAKKHHIDNYDEMMQDFLAKQVENYLHIQDKTSKQTDQLSKTTSKAIEAIKEKNDEALADVLFETQKLRKEIDKLKESLYRDELTGAYNRKWLHDHLISATSNQFAKKGVMALIDLNYFKTINDTYGHIIGDKVLVFITTQLKKVSPHVVRYGGDEFLVFFEGSTSCEDVKSLMRKKRDELLKKHLKAKDAEFRVSFSIGVTVFQKGENLNEVIERADVDMYDDKVQIKKSVTGIDV